MKNIATLVVNIIRELNKHKIYASRINIHKMAFLIIKEDKKDLYFKPYSYGLYSETIQTAIQSLFYKKQITFDYNIGYKVKKNDYLLDYYKNIIDFTMEFLKKHNLMGEKLISDFAKIYCIYCKNSNMGIEEIISIIKLISKFIWHEIHKKSEDELKKYIEISKEYLKAKGEII